MKNKSVKRELNPIQQSLFSKLKDIMLVDQRRLSARIHGIGKIKSQEAQQAVAAEIQLQIEQAQLRVENRKSAVKNPIVFPESLPVSQRKAEIQKLLSEHPRDRGQKAVFHSLSERCGRMICRSGLPHCTSAGEVKQVLYAGTGGAEFASQ